MKCYVCDTDTSDTSNGVAVHVKCAKPDLADFGDPAVGFIVGMDMGSEDKTVGYFSEVPTRTTERARECLERAQAELRANVERLRRELNGGKDEQRPHLGDWIRSEGRAIGEVSAVDFTENRATIDLFDTTKWDRIVVPFNQFKKDDDGFWSISLDAERSTTEAP